MFLRKECVHLRIIRGVEGRDLVTVDSRSAKGAHAVDHRAPRSDLILHDDHLVARRQAVHVLAGNRRRVVRLAEAHHTRAIRLPDRGEDNTQARRNRKRVRRNASAFRNAQDIVDGREIGLQREPPDCGLQFVGMHRPVAPVEYACKLSPGAADNGHYRKLGELRGYVGARALVTGRVRLHRRLVAAGVARSVRLCACAG